MENKDLMGWTCPKCGRVYSPYTSMCSFCSGFPTQGSTGKDSKEIEVDTTDLAMTSDLDLGVEEKYKVIDTMTNEDKFFGTYDGCIKYIKSNNNPFYSIIP